jgi:hypothetical protein
MKYRDLEKVRQIIKYATNLDVMYAYDDLVFPEHSAFIIKFDDEDQNNFFCYFHKDCIAEDQSKLLENLQQAGNHKSCKLLFKGIFDLKQKGEEVEIHFL